MLLGKTLTLATTITPTLATIMELTARPSTLLMTTTMKNTKRPSLTATLATQTTTTTSSRLTQLPPLLPNSSTRAIKAKTPRAMATVTMTISITTIIMTTQAISRQSLATITRLLTTQHQLMYLTLTLSRMTHWMKAWLAILELDSLASTEVINVD